MPRQSHSAESVTERRKYVRATLVGSALVSPQSGAKGFTAVFFQAEDGIRDKAT